MSTFFFFQKFVDNARNILTLLLKQTFQPMILIFTEGEGDGLKSRLPLKIFSFLADTKEKPKIEIELQGLLI